MGFGERIRYIRKNLGLTLDEVASRAGLHKSNISEIENEKRFKPNLKTLEKLALALQCQVGDFFELAIERDEEITGGLADLLDDSKSMILLKITPDETEWLKSVRFRYDQRPTKDTYIELLYTYRKLEDPSEDYFHGKDSEE